jgi:hypothetical protein
MSHESTSFDAQANNAYDALGETEKEVYRDWCNRMYSGDNNIQNVSIDVLCAYYYFGDIILYDIRKGLIKLAAVDSTITSTFSQTFPTNDPYHSTVSPPIIDEIDSDSDSETVKKDYNESPPSDSGDSDDLSTDFNSLNINININYKTNENKEKHEEISPSDSDKNSNNDEENEENIDDFFYDNSACNSDKIFNYGDDDDDYDDGNSSSRSLSNSNNNSVNNSNNNSQNSSENENENEVSDGVTDNLVIALLYYFKRNFTDKNDFLGPISAYKNLLYIFENYELRIFKDTISVCDDYYDKIHTNIQLVH